MTARLITEQAYQAFLRDDKRFENQYHIVWQYLESSKLFTLTVEEKRIIHAQAKAVFDAEDHLSRKFYQIQRAMGRQYIYEEQIVKGYCMYYATLRAFEHFKEKSIKNLTTVHK